MSRTDVTRGLLATYCNGDDTTRFALHVALSLLLSPVMHWAVLINTNAWYGCEEGIQTLVNEDFAHRKLCDPPTYASRELEEALRGVKCIHIHLRVFMNPIY